MRLEAFGLGPSFDPEKFNPIRNQIKKPYGGLWTSPVGSKRSFADFCKIALMEERVSGLSFVVNFEGNLMVIDSKEDWNKLPLLADKKPDFEALAREYDGLWLTYKGLLENRWGYFYAWDCKTVLVFNPDCISQE